MAEQSKGWILPEIVIEDVLRSGFADIRARIIANSIDEYLARAFYSPTPATDARMAEIRAQVKAWLPTIKSERPGFFIAGYPNDQQFLPCIAITLLAESEGAYVGDQAADVEFPDESFGTETVQPWTSPIGVSCFDENGDALRFLYHLAKFILAGQRRTLTKIFDLDFKMSGQDLGLVQWSGRNIRHRLLRVTGEYEQYNAALDSSVDVLDFTLNQESNYAQPGIGS